MYLFIELVINTILMQKFSIYKNQATILRVKSLKGSSCDYIETNKSLSFYRIGYFYLIQIKSINTPPPPPSNSERCIHKRP